MAAAKKGKKKSGSKGKKKSGNSSFFTKFILVLLVLAMIVAAILFTLNNFNIKEIRINNNENDAKTEIVVKKDENKSTTKPSEKTKTTVETKAKSESKTEKPAEIKVETSTKPLDTKEKTAELKQEVKEAKTMTGSWHSSEQGAFLTMDEYGYRIDFSNVHASKPITGNYRIENNLIVFSSDGSECGKKEGTYRINFFKKNISLTCKSDDCTDRRNILEADWEWLEY